MDWLIERLLGTPRRIGADWRFPLMDASIDKTGEGKKKKRDRLKKKLNIYMCSINDRLLEKALIKADGQIICFEGAHGFFSFLASDWRKQKLMNLKSTLMYSSTSAANFVHLAVWSYTNYSRLLFFFFPSLMRSCCPSPVMVLRPTCLKFTNLNPVVTLTWFPRRVLYSMCVWDILCFLFLLWKAWRDSTHLIHWILVNFQNCIWCRAWNDITYTGSSNRTCNSSTCDL